MGKVNSNSILEKSMGKQKYSKVMVSYIFRVKQKSIQFLKHGKSEFEYRKGVGKINISKLWVSYIFCVKQKSIPFPNHGKSEFPTGKLWENKKHSKSMGFLQVQYFV